jgi:hypothetical protein
LSCLSSFIQNWKAYLFFFQFHAQSLTKTLKQCTYQLKMKYKYQSILPFGHTGEVKCFTDWFQIFERKNIFEHTDGAWAIISLTKYSVRNFWTHLNACIWRSQSDFSRCMAAISWFVYRLYKVFKLNEDLTLSLPEGYCFIVHLFARGFSKKLLYN